MKIKYLFYLTSTCFILTGCNCCCDKQNYRRTEYIQKPKVFSEAKEADPIFNPLRPKKSNQVNETPGASADDIFSKNDFNTAPKNPPRNFSSSENLPKRRGAHASASAVVNININRRN